MCKNVSCCYDGFPQRMIRYHLRGSLISKYFSIDICIKLVPKRKHSRPLRYIPNKDSALWTGSFYLLCADTAKLNIKVKNCDTDKKGTGFSLLDSNLSLSFLLSSVLRIVPLTCPHGSLPRKPFLSPGGCRLFLAKSPSISAPSETRRGRRQEE